MNGEKRQPNEKNCIGGNDAAFIPPWPGILYNNTRDYPMWAASVAWRSARCAPTCEQ